MRLTTIEDSYEYRIVQIIKKVMADQSAEGYVPEDGDGLEQWLADHKAGLLNELLYDIHVYMGFDELLEQIKGESK